MEQFYRFSAELKNDKNLNNDEKVAFMYIYDRMCSSVKRSEFFDKVKNDYYVIYTVDEMIEDLNKSKNTVLKVFRKLEELGYIIAKKVSHKATRFFVPSFTSGSEIEPTKVQKLNPNQTNLNHKHNNKQVNTENVDENYDGESKLTQWIQSTNSVVGLTLNTLKTIKSFSKNKVDDCKHIVRIILNARNSVAKEHGVSKTAVTQFESNKRLQDDLGKQLDHVFSYIKNHGYTSYYGYLTNSLKDYFKIAFGLAKPTKIVKPEGQNVRFSGHKPIKEELPDWAKKTPEERKAKRQKEDTMTEEEHEARKAELENKLAMIRSKFARKVCD